MLLVCSCSKTEINLRPQDAHTNKISAVDPQLHVAAFIMIFVKGGVRHETSNSMLAPQSTDYSGNYARISAVSQDCSVAWLRIQKR